MPVKLCHVARTCSQEDGRVGPRLRLNVVHLTKYAAHVSQHGGKQKRRMREMIETREGIQQRGFTSTTLDAFPFS